MTSLTLKRSLFGVVLASSLLATGCDNTANTTDDSLSDTEVQIEETQTDNTAITPTAVTPTTSVEEPFVMTTIGMNSINSMIFTPLINSGELTGEQATCLAARDNNLGQTELQDFYKRQFSDAELQELDDFYNSDVGQKMLQFGEQEMVIMNGGEVATPMADPTPDEIAEIQAFMQSPTGVKYVQTNNALGEGSAILSLEEPINAEFQRCNIDLTLAQLMQPAPAQ